MIVILAFDFEVYCDVVSIGFGNESNTLSNVDDILVNPSLSVVVNLNNPVSCSNTSQAAGSKVGLW